MGKEKKKKKETSAFQQTLKAAGDVQQINKIGRYNLMCHERVKPSIDFIGSLLTG